MPARHVAVAMALGWSMALAVSGASSAQSPGAPSFAATPGQLQAAADSLDLRALDGSPLTAAALRGRTVLLDFWATWCAPCLAELPNLRRLRERHGPRFEVVGISVDVMTRRDLMAWLTRQRVAWPMVHDGRGFASPTIEKFRVGALPASVLLAPDGTIVGLNLRGEALADRVAQLLQPPGF